MKNKLLLHVVKFELQTVINGVMQLHRCFHIDYIVKQIKKEVPDTFPTMSYHV